MEYTLSGDLMTVEQAAQHLAVSTRTVRTYIKDGWLVAVKTQGSRRKWLRSDDVSQLRLDKQQATEGGRSLRQELLELKARTRRLEAQMTAIMAILDSQDKPLRLQTKEAKDIYGACLGHLHQTEWEFAQISAWVQIFSRLTEDDLQVMREATDDTKPWVPFLRLVMHMTAFVADHPTYTTNLELQTLHRELAEARRRLRVSAFCYADLHSYDMNSVIRTTALADTPESIRDTLSSVLRKRKRK